MKRIVPFGALAFLLGAAVFSRQIDAAARPQAPSQAPAAAKDPQADEGIPIANAKVKSVCGDCHRTDEKGRMSRISFRRTTPEGWQETIRRMATLNHADIDPVDAREIVKYLSDHLGLAPEEVKPAAFEVERRLIDFKYTASADAEGVCSSCHSMGRVMLQRRTGREWDLLVAMHRGWYPLVDGQVFRRGGPPSTTPGPDGRAPDNRHPMDKALAHLKPAFPFTTPEWTAWSATMRSPRLEGTWLLSGN
jgi:quinohemoprotein amine dehydrogenase